MGMKFHVYAAILMLVLAGCGGGITAYESGGGDYDSMIENGWVYYNNSQFEEAQDLFCAAKEFDGTKPDAYLGCGWSLFMRQKPDSALVVFFQGFDYYTSFDDTVDASCGIAGCYLARNENSKVISYLQDYDLETFEDAFPLREHDFFLDRGDLELVYAQAYYRLGMFSSSESADPDNAVYHFSQVQFTEYTYTTAEKLMEDMTEYLSESDGGL